MKSQIEAKMNELRVTTAYTQDGNQFRWKGEIPDGIDIVAPFANYFISDANLNKWLRQCGVTEDNKTDDKYDQMSRHKLVEYAASFGYDLKLGRKSKDQLIEEVKEAESGLFD